MIWTKYFELYLKSPSDEVCLGVTAGSDWEPGVAGHDIVEAGVLVHLEATGEVRACAMLLDSTLEPGVGDRVGEAWMTELIVPPLPCVVLRVREELNLPASCTQLRVGEEWKLDSTGEDSDVSFMLAPARFIPGSLVNISGEAGRTDENTSVKDSSCEACSLSVSGSSLLSTARSCTSLINPLNPIVHFW